MAKGTRWAVALAIVAATTTCGTGEEPGGTRASGSAPTEATLAVSPSDLSSALAVLSQHAVFFDHASVGMNVMAGLDRLLASASGAHPTRLDWGQTRGVGASQVAGVVAGTWADHYFVAENGFPLDKMAEFRTADLGGGLGARLDALGGAAAMKLCFADFDSPGLTTAAAVDAAFSTYQAGVASIQTSYPGLKLLHVTSALRSGDNALRERYNQKLRDAYGGAGRVFDLAAVESNGHVDGSGIRFLDPAYNDGSDHLTTSGQDAVASALVVFTAGAFQPAQGSVALSPSSVVGGASSTGTVTLTGAAPAGGASVALSSDSPVATVPATVTVAAGATSATFPVSTAVVAATTAATITGSYGGTSWTAVLAVTPPAPPPTLASAALSPSSVVGGASSTGTVTLSGAAPAGGASVALSSDAPAATVPATVTVAAGATSVTFPVSTAVVTATTTATITASYAAVSRTATLTVTPAPVSSLAQDAGFPTRNVLSWASGTRTFSFTTPGANRLVVVAIAYSNYLQAAPAHTVSGGGLTWSLARQTLTDSTGTFVALWSAWAPTAATYTATFNSGLTRPYDAFLTVHSFSGSSASGIGAVAGASGSGTRPTLDAITTTGSTSYLLAVGTYDAPTSPVASAGSTVTALDLSAGPAFWTQRTTALLPPGLASIGLSTPTSAPRWAMAAVEIKVGGPAPPPVLASEALSPSSVVGGASSTGTVTLSGAAPAGGASVALSSDSPVATVPATVTVAAGATSATFPVATAVVAATTTATITASYAAMSRIAVLTVTPPPPPATLASVALSPSSVVGGASSTGTVTLSGTAPAGGASVALSSDAPAATVPVTVTVAAGATSVTFPVSTAVVTATTTATITASYAAVSRTATLTVTPAPVSSLAQDAGFPTRNVLSWASGTRTFSFTTPGANRLVVVAIAYSNYLQAAPAHTVSGGGLTWSLARQTLTDSTGTFVALWSAWAPTAATYTATFNSGLTRRYDAFLTVHSFSGSSASGVGAVAGASGSGTRPTLDAITTTGSTSYLLAVGTYDAPTSPVASAGSTVTALDLSAGPAFWTQRTTALLPPGPASIGLSTPTSAPAWAMAALEIRSAP